MITTRFLSDKEYPLYGQWLKSQDQETLNLYFGMAVSHEQIDSLMGRILADPQDHAFLVAERRGRIVGSIHIAQMVDEVEFGVIVAQDQRGHGIADTMLAEAIIWSRNRGFHVLYMHCLAWNQPIKHLCLKHGLEVKTQSGESELRVPLEPANAITVGKEVAIKNKNVFKMFLQTNPFFQELYG
jgi:RimJ/RimL family protein N-acetyltransferase